MAELEIDQSNLPRVQEVCQCFAVLEDGVLAHSLQEQEIEQYYTTNIQKNQLVQNDIRVAKMLQHEEEEQGAQESALHRQTSRQLEEQDSEYARLIQEEIQRCAEEEARRREREDEEIAKRIQEEEEQRTRRRSRGRDSFSDDDSGGPSSASVQQRALSSPRQRHRSTHASRSQRSNSHTQSDFTGRQAQESLRAPPSDEGHRDSRSESVETLSDHDTEDSDTVFPQRLPQRSRRLNGSLHTAPCQRRASLRLPREQNHRSLCHSHVSGSTEEQRGCEEEGGGREWKERVCDLDDRRNRRRSGGWERNGEERTERNGDHNRDVQQRRCSRSQSVRLQDGDRHTDGRTDTGADRRTARDLARTWSYRENPDRHVRFQDDDRRCNSYHGSDRGVWEMLGQVLRDRGVAVRHGAAPQPQARPRSGDSRGSHGDGSEASYGSADPRPQKGAFQRAAPARRSYHRDVREVGRLSSRETSERDYRGDRERRHYGGLAIEEEEDGVEVDEEEPRRDSDLRSRERGGSRRWRRGAEFRPRTGSSVREEVSEEERPCNGDRRVRRSTSERRRGRVDAEECLSSEQEELTVERREERTEERPHRRAPQRSQSLLCSSVASARRARSTHAPPGAAVQCLDLVELQQVLRDQELARRLQDEEDRVLVVRRSPQPSSSSRSSYPEGDFRVAQVAQDEEIARFMQKREITWKRRSREVEGPVSWREDREMSSRSREVEGPVSWREDREMSSHYDPRASRERQGQRERLDSEGLPSPTEDYSPETQPPSPVSSTPQVQHIRNIAEELDPTFKARTQNKDSLRVGQTGPPYQSPPLPHSGLPDFTEEPTFIPPTKRPSDKSARSSKAKEKKENCKQQ